MTVSRTTTGISGKNKLRKDSGRRARVCLTNLLFFAITCLAVESTAFGATYYWQDDSGTSVAGFTTDSTGCGSQELDVYLTTLMVTGGFNCTNFRVTNDNPAPQNIWLMIKDTSYAVATDVTGIDFALNFLDDASDGVTARYELGYATGGVFTSFGFADEGPHEPQATYVTDLSAISGTAPAGSHLALRILDVAPSPGSLRMFMGSNNSSGILNVTETVALTPEIVKRSFETDGTPIPHLSSVPNYLEFKYLLYINNTGSAISDISVRDVLAAAFQYQLGTIQVDNSVAECALVVCTAVEELAIFTAVDGATVLTDAVDLDAASYTGAGLVIDAGDENIGNPQLDINADAVWAILFSVKMP